MRMVPWRTGLDASSLWTVRLLLLALVVDRAHCGPKEVWTAWSEWTECSFTCGRGVRSRYRECVGQAAGKLVRLEKPNCSGRSREFVICQKQPCPVGSDDERETQCSEQNTQELLGSLYHWVPFYGGPNPCQLTCLARGYSFYYNFGSVRDGTPCKKGSNDLCVNGHCAAVGCDDHVGSQAEVDNCGLCGGQNINCAYFRQTYSRTLPSSGDYGYNEIVKIPSGATHLKVTDTSSNYLALADSDYTYFINGNWVIDWPGRYEMAGTTINYGRSGPNNETITAKGPIKEDLHLMLIFREKNPGVSYEFWLPTDKLDRIKLNVAPSSVKLPNPAGRKTVAPVSGNAATNQRGHTARPPGDAKESPTTDSRRGPSHSTQHDSQSTESGRNGSPQSRTPPVNGTHPPGTLLPHRPSGLVTGPGYGSAQRYSYPPVSPVRPPAGNGGSRTNRQGAPTSNSKGDALPAGVTRSKLWRDGLTRGSSSVEHTAPNVNTQLDDVSSAKTDYISRREAKTDVKPTVSLTTIRTRSPKGERKNGRSDPRRKKKSNSIGRTKSQCQPCKKIKNRAKHFCLSNFAIRIMVLKQEEIGTGNDTRYDIRIVSKYRETLTLLSREFLWVPNRCRCPRLHENREYVVIGTLAVDALTQEGRLQLDRDSFVRPYNQANDSRMRNLQQHVDCSKYG